MEKESYSWVLVVVILLLIGSSMLMGHGYMRIGMGFGFVVMVLFWVAVIWLISGLAKEKSGAGDSIDIIKERYAKGELTKKQFEQMKKELSGVQ
ncbi:MAG TPA: SHOCT domain-containing protein [Candidatus Nanoarchaeia archaeon]|nr:SHOCT domain-containing protein [Candidatus Nanoarchaeia archaeon]